MKKLFKYAIFTIAGVVVLSLALAAYFALTFNPNDYKQKIIDLVKEKNDRTLSIDGDIKLAFWPKIGADLGKVAISEHQSDKAFASVNSVKVALAVMPLLKKELVVDTIYVDGAKANIVKYKDGSNNYDNLVSQNESESETIKFNVQGINITNSEISYRDETNDAKYHIEEFNMVSGHVALAEPVDLDTSFTITSNQPALTARTELKGNFLFDPERKHFKVKGLDGHVTGNMFDGKDVDVKASGDFDAKINDLAFLIDGLRIIASGDFNGVNQTIELNAPSINIQQDKVSSNKVTISLLQNKVTGETKVNMNLADMQGSPKAIQSSGITGDIFIKEGKRTVKAEFSSPFSANIENLVFDIPKLVGNLEIKGPSLPDGKVSGSFNLSANTDIKKEFASTIFSLALDDTKLKGDITVSGFKKQNIKFNLNSDKIDLNKLLGQSNQVAATQSKTTNSKPADISVLNNMTIDGKLNIGSIVYDNYRVSGLNVGVKANGQKLSLNGLNVKVDDSQIKGAFSVSEFSKPVYRFDLDIDQLNLDKYISKETNKVAESGAKKSSEDAILDFSALKALNANGSIRIGKLNYGKTKASKVRIDLKADGGVATLSPFSANLYNGSMNGLLKVDTRSTPNIAFKQNMNSISIGPLLSDTINNDMLSGTGSVNVDITMQGNKISSLKKALAGKAALNLADGAIKGIDIAGNVRDLKNKVNILKSKDTIDADADKKTDFSELTATFDIKNGVAHNEDLAMKAPILRLAKGNSRGDIDIANETINYIAKPTIVKSLKGQGGEDLNQLSGIAIPIKISGTFDKPKYGMDYSALATGLAQSKLLDKVGGGEGIAIKELISGGNEVDALEGLLGKKKSTGSEETSDDAARTETAPKEESASVEDHAKEKLKNILKF